MRRLATLALLLVILFAADRAVAKDAPQRPPASDEIADRAIAAFDAHDDAAFRAATALGKTGWAATDAILRRGRPDVAKAFAETFDDEDKDALVAYVERVKDEPQDAIARQAIVDADAAFARRDFAGALDALDGIRSQGLAELWVLSGRATALRYLGRFREASDAFAEAGAHAASLGCRAGAWRTYQIAAQLAKQANDSRRNREAQTRALEIAEQRPVQADLAASLIDLGLADDWCGDRAAAERHYTRGIAVARKAGHEAFLANGLTNLGLLLLRRRNAEAAEPLLVEALALHRKVGNGVFAARAEGGLAQVLALKGDDEGAVAAWESTAAAQEAIGDQAGVATTLGDLSAWHSSQGRGARAIETAERALEVARRTPSPLAIATAERWCAAAYRSAGRLDEAIDHLRAALDVHTRLQDEPGMCSTTFELSSALLSRAEFAEAERCARQSLAIAQQNGWEQATARAQTALGNTRARLGDTESGAKLLREALAYFARGGPSGEHAQALGNVGFVHMARSEYGPALERTLEARAMAEEVGDTRLAWDFLSNLGAIYSAFGDTARAIDLARKVVRGADAHEDKAKQASAYVNLGVMLADAGDLEDAREKIEHGLALAVESGATLWEATALANLGMLAARADDWAAAEGWYRKALARAREMNALREISTFQSALAHAALQQGRRGDALAQAAEAAAVAAEAGDPGTIADAEIAYARALLDGGDEAGAIEHARRSADAAVRMAQGVPQTAVAGDSGYWNSIAAIGTEAARRSGDVEAVFDFLERSRAGQLLEGLGGRNGLREKSVPPDLAAEEQSRRAEVLSARAHLSAATQAKDLKRARAAREALLDAESAYEDVVARIQIESRAGAAAVFPHPTTTAEVRAALAPDEAFVAYAQAVDALLAIVLTRDGVRMVEIGEGKTTDALAKSLSDGGPPEERTARLSEAKRTLYDALGLPETVRRVTISPYESVVFVPFAALDPTRSFAYVPSATTRVVLAKQRVEPGRHVLALGNPDYSVRGVAPAPGGPVALRGGTLTPLPGSGEEAKAVGDVVLLAKDATETVLSEKLAKQPRWHAVHFACHGLVDDQRPMRSALAVTPDASSDGMLSVLEIYRMQVASDLVVLSACESGRGRVAGSEGVVGFTGAFLLAGADRVIASLWKVDDEATRALMTKFYEVWKGGKTPTADALRIAQDHVRSQPKWADPRYWAAWQLWGLPD